MRVEVRKNKGFTLVETVVTAVIIGTIAGFALPSFQSAAERTRAQEGESMLLETLRSVNDYSLDRGGACPASLSAMNMYNITSGGFCLTNLDIDCSGDDLVDLTLASSNGKYLLRMNSQGKVSCINGTSSTACSKLPYDIVD